METKHDFNPTRGQVQRLVSWIFPRCATGWLFCAQAFAWYFAFGTFWHGLFAGVWLALVIRNTRENPANVAGEPHSEARPR